MSVFRARPRLTKLFNLRGAVILAFGLALLILTGIVWAQTGYDLTWWTVDGGAETFSGGGSYILNGAVGQPDASVWEGGGYTLVGGFWGGAKVTPQPEPDTRIYLSLVLRNYTPPATIPLHVGDAIPRRAVVYQGEVFYTASVRMPDKLPSDGHFYFSSRRDAVAEVVVDDLLAIMLDGSEVFAYDFSTSGLPEPTILEVPRPTMEQLAGQTVTIEYRDVYGVFVMASEMWLVWKP
jgi:hypothetical protein